MNPFYTLCLCGVLFSTAIWIFMTTCTALVCPDQSNQWPVHNTSRRRCGSAQINSSLFSQSLLERHATSEDNRSRRWLEIAFNKILIQHASINFPTSRRHRRVPGENDAFERRWSTRSATSSSTVAIRLPAINNSDRVPVSKMSDTSILAVHH